MAPCGAISLFVLDTSMLGYVLGHRVDSRPPVAIGWAMLAVGLSLPWLMPIHSRPWTGFHADVLMALVFLSAMAIVTAAARGRWVLPSSSVVLLGFSTIPFLQYAGGLIFFAADALMPGLYLLGFALAIALGARAETRWPGRLAPAVFASFAVAAVVSFAIALNQWLGIDQWGAFTLAGTAGGRFVANVGQPNNLATLYVWALLAFWWAFHRDIVRGWLVVVVAGLLLFGIVMTQSRTGMLAVFALTGVAVIHPRALRTGGQRLAVAMLFLWFLGCLAAWGPLNGLLQLAAPQTVAERLVPGTRMLHWQLVGDAILQRPLFGWGWHQVGVAQSTLAPMHPATGEVIRSSHNLVLDLLAWNGLPLGLLATAAIGIWYVRRWRAAQDATHVLAMAMLSAFLWHALLEQPHLRAIFLVPAGLLAGVLSTNTFGPRQGAGGPVRRGWVALAVLALMLCTALVLRDYFRVEAAWMAERLRAARIGSLEPKPLPDTLTLGHLQAVLELGRAEPRAGMTGGEIEAMRRITFRMPGRVGMLKLARAQAMNGQVSEAEMTLDRLCRMNPRPVCERVRDAWSRGIP